LEFSRSPDISWILGCVYAVRSIRQRVRCCTKTAVDSCSQLNDWQDTNDVSVCILSGLCQGHKFTDRTSRCSMLKSRSPHPINTSKHQSLCRQALKHGSKKIAIASGVNGEDAFWRRPSACGRGEGSPGFPSAHTSNCGAISTFWSLQFWNAGASLALPASLTLMMAAGRMSDGNHTALQTVAGVLLGPLLGGAADLITRHYSLGQEPLASSLGWHTTTVVCVVAAFVYLWRHSGPVWLASWRRYCNRV